MAVLFEQARGRYLRAIGAEKAFARGPFAKLMGAADTGGTACVIRAVLLDMRCTIGAVAVGSGNYYKRFT